MEKYDGTRQATDDDIIQCRKYVICMQGNWGKNTDSHSHGMKYFVAWQECKENPLLQFHSITEHLNIVDSEMNANNNIKGKYCCVSMKQWLCEPATM